MQLPETETGSSVLNQAMEECTVSSPVLPLTGSVLSQTLGFLSLGAIPPHMSGLLAMVAHHLPSLTGNSDLSLTRMVVALEPL